MPAYYKSLVSEFLDESEESVRDELTAGYSADKYADLKTAQVDAWRHEIKVLRAAFTSPTLLHRSADWPLLLEFPIPRRRSRIDAVMLIGACIVVLEFKKSDDESSAAATQVEDYALELSYFHRPSQGRHIYPVVVADGIKRPRRTGRDHLVRPVQFCSYGDLAATLSEIADAALPAERVNPDDWNAGAYFPVPTVVEAAVGMFQQMQVADIAHADADAKNLNRTIKALRRIIAESAASHQKSVCFVTGVPGAGKTLAGLSLVHDPIVREQVGTRHLTFVSGNLPLVEVLRRALYEDQVHRKTRRTYVRDPETTIITVYSFKNTEWIRAESDPPAERVLIFDEAQRAWDRKANLKKLKGQDKKPCDLSEPELILHILNRHRDWATLVCLVGGGQEIHTGEAGLQAWGAAIQTRHQDWRVYASPAALESEGMQALFGSAPVDPKVCITTVPDLHLDNPLRQFRGKSVATWVERVISRKSADAASILSENANYPIVITRSLQKAKEWLKDRARGTQRFGLIASSGAKRLRAYGIHVPGARDGDVVSWFLKPTGDVRSSFQLEIAATEFQVQGLELDWSCLCWGGDYLIDPSNTDWHLKHFEGTAWKNVADETARNYLVNTYRVLLTRARLGMVLFVPEGKHEDPTTTPEGYDRTAAFLESCGARRI